MSKLRHDAYMALLDQMAKLQLRKLELEKEQESLRDRIHIIHAKLVLEIGSLKDEKGKLVYSNEQLRNAALAVKLDEHQEFRELRGRNRSIDHKISELAIEYNKLIDQKYLLMVELGISFETENEKYPDIH